MRATPRAKSAGRGTPRTATPKATPKPRTNNNNNGNTTAATTTTHGPRKHPPQCATLSPPPVAGSDSSDAGVESTPMLPPRRLLLDPPTHPGAAAGPDDAATAAPPPEHQASLVGQLPLPHALRCMASTGTDSVWVGDRTGSVSTRQAVTAAAAGGAEGAVVYKAAAGVLPNAMAVVQEQGQVWVGFSDGVVRVFAAAAGSLVKELQHHAGAVLDLHAAGGAVFSAGQDWKVNQWSVGSLKHVSTFTGHSNAVRCLTTGACLASGSDDETIRLWGEQKRVLKGHSGSVLRLLAVGDALWSGGEDGVVMVWDAAEGVCTRRLGVHKAPISALVSVGCEAVWSADKYGVVAVWTTAGQLTQRLSPSGTDWQRNGIWCACVAARTTSWRVWTGSGDDALRVWETPAAPHAAVESSLRAELAALRNRRTLADVHLEAMLRDNDAAELKKRAEDLQTALCDKETEVERLAMQASDLEGEAALAKVELDRLRTLHAEVEKLRKRNKELEKSASESDAKAVVLGKECAARTAALDGLEEEKQEHENRLGRVVELERELSLEKKRRESEQQTVACFEAQNGELRARLREAEAATDELNDEITHLSAPSATPSVDAIIIVATSLLLSVEVASRDVLLDLQHHLFSNLNRAFQAGLQYSLTPSTIPCFEPTATEQSARESARDASTSSIFDPLPQARTSTEQGLHFRILTLEQALTESQKQLLSQTSEGQESCARIQQLEASLAVHKNELTETAAELARARCEVSSRIAEVNGKEKGVQRLQECLQGKDAELVAITQETHAYRQQLEQSIACIASLEAALKAAERGTEARQQKLDSVPQRIQQLEAGHAKEVDSFALRLRLKDEELLRIETRRADSERDADNLKKVIEILRRDLDQHRVKVAKHEESILRTDDDRAQVASKYSEVLAVVDQLKGKLSCKQDELHQLQRERADDVSVRAAATDALQGKLLDAQSALAEREAKLCVLEAQLHAKTEQYSRQTNVLSEVLSEVTDRRRHSNELASRVEELERGMRDPMGQSAGGSSSDADQQQRRQWELERAHLQEVIQQLQQNSDAGNVHTFSAVRAKLDATQRELAVQREESRCEIQMLHAQLAAKSGELMRLQKQHHSRLLCTSPPGGSPAPFILRSPAPDDGEDSGNGMQHLESRPNMHSKSLTPPRLM